jgi:PHD/YefM family antitoxin component YafN of YafNO toxin-antitoxin module
MSKVSVTIEKSRGEWIITVFNSSHTLVRVAKTREEVFSIISEYLHD